MDRRTFVKLGIGAAAGTSTFVQAGEAVELSAIEQQALMSSGKVSAQALTRACLDRIGKIDKAGPAINAMIELNPDALAIAAAMDAERGAGKLRGPLHGIPFVIKDNIATGDKMSTTAGSLALDGVRAAKDAHLIARLRAAGAVLIGKTNLSEWANMRSMRSTAGWSARGGLTRNPYALDRSCGGSSSGSGAAVAANLATLAVGTETDGSIVCPSSICGLVGIKPTVGLISRSGVIRISSSFDTAGPMARTVADAALMLSAMAGPDQRDPSTLGSPEKPLDYTASLVKDGLKGMRLGVARNYFVRNPQVRALIENQLKVLEAQGATLVDVTIPNKGKYENSAAEVMLTEFKAELTAYLAEYAPEAKIRTLSDVIAFNSANEEREMPYFAQEGLEYARSKGSLASSQYRDGLERCRRLARVEGVDNVMDEHRLDALIAPTSIPGWVSDFYKRGKPDGGFTTPAAVTGYPHITVPAGYLQGLPVGLSFVGRAWSEAALIRMAYGYEQATLHRQLPRFPQSAAQPIISFPNEENAAGSLLRTRVI